MTEIEEKQKFQQILEQAFPNYDWETQYDEFYHTLNAVGNSINDKAEFTQIKAMKADVDENFTEEFGMYHINVDGVPFSRVRNITKDTESILKNLYVKYVSLIDENLKIENMLIDIEFSEI